MKRIAFYLVALAMAAGILALTAPLSGQADEEAAPIYGIKLPAGYRDWTLISVANVGAPVNDIRAKLGNDIAIKAYRDGKLPFPDGTILARLAYQQVTSEENNNAIRPFAEKALPPELVKKLLDGSFVAGPPTNVQFMVKDSVKYASTGGWGFAQFNHGKPADAVTIKTCFSCHQPAKDHDFVFTRYAP
ncbi:MAG TPA: cytochrome P460 family protein [Terriglobales bacterium]|nr:cytochrome P460 family protein [Terriglobales bacterium]